MTSFSLILLFCDAAFDADLAELPSSVLIVDLRGLAFGSLFCSLPSASAATLGPVGGRDGRPGGLEDVGLVVLLVLLGLDSVEVVSVGGGGLFGPELGLAGGPALAGTSVVGDLLA